MQYKPTYALNEPSFRMVRIKSSNLTPLSEGSLKARWWHSSLCYNWYEKYAVFCVFYMTFYNLQNSVKLLPESAGKILHIKWWNGKQFTHWPCVQIHMSNGFPSNNYFPFLNKKYEITCAFKSNQNLLHYTNKSTMCLFI